MTKLEKTLYDLILPLVNNKDDLQVSESQSGNGSTIFLNVESDKNDISRLIGRRGTMANSIRQTMLIAGRLDNKKIMINFEALKDA